MSRRETIEARLREIAAEQERLAVALEELYTERLALWLEGYHNLAMTQREVAAPSGVTEGAVTQALRKVRLGG